MIARAKDQLYRLLRWSERYTKTDMVYLARGGAWSMLATLLSTLFSFGTSLAFANLLSKEAYGTYQYVLVVADLFGIFVLSGIDTALARSVARGMDGSLYDGFWAKVRWGLLGGAGSILLGGYYFAQGNTLLGYAFILTGAFIPFWEAPALYVTYLQGKKRFDLNSMFEVGAQFVSTAAILGALLFTENVLILLTVFLGAWGAGRFFFLWLTLRKTPPNAVKDPGMIPYGKHLTVMAAVSTFASSADDILLWHFLGPAAVATYIFATAIPIRASGVIKTVNRLAFPKLAMQEHSNIKRTLPRKVFLLFGLASLSALMYAALAPYLFALFFPRYMEAVPYTQLLAALVALQPFNLFSSALTAQAKHRALYLYYFAVPGFRIALFLALIPPFGIWGAVLGTVLTDIFDSIVATALFYRAR